MPDTERLQLRFRTTITDGAYQNGGGIPFDRPYRATATQQAGSAGTGLRLLPPAPIREFPAVRFGTTVGIELGYAFEVTKSGKDRPHLTLPIKSFKEEAANSARHRSARRSPRRPGSRAAATAAR